MKLCLILIVFSISYRTDLGFLMGFQPTYQYMATLSRMDGLLIGAVVAVLIRQHPSLLEKLVLPVLVISLIAVVTGIAIIGRINFLSLPSIYTFLDLFSASLLILCLSSRKIPIVSRLVHFKGLIWTGKYSYGLYVYHYILFIILSYNLTDPLTSMLGNPVLSEMAIGGITIILSLIISALSYQYLESPFLGLKKYFSHKKQRIPVLRPDPVSL